MEGLREELLNLTGTVDRKALLLGQLVHTQNGNDVLKVGVLLQELLDLDGDTVVLLADDRGSRASEEDASGSIAGNRPSDEMLRERTVVASRCVNVVAGAGSVRSSAGT